tara:strand:+ start:199 stop:471 length:273 start_codon:yes stop_codon:yes gene_type:complete
MAVLARINELESKLRFGSTLKTVFGTATSFLIALAWRDAIKELVDRIIDTTDLDKSKVWTRYPHTMYALFVTVLGVLLLYALGENKFVKK